MHSVPDLLRKWTSAADTHERTMAVRPSQHEWSKFRELTSEKRVQYQAAHCIFATYLRRLIRRKDREKD